MVGAGGMVSGVEVGVGATAAVLTMPLLTIIWGAQEIPSPKIKSKRQSFIFTGLKVPWIY
jgi:hypothetical protein